MAIVVVIECDICGFRLEAAPTEKAARWLAKEFDWIRLNQQDICPDCQEEE